MTTTRLKSASLALVTAFGVIGATLLPAGAPLHAREAASNSRAVAHRDLDLATEGGKRKLDARVRRAASALCLDPRELSLRVKIARKACYNRAVTGAERSVATAVARDLAVRSTRSAAAE